MIRFAKERNTNSTSWRIWKFLNMRSGSEDRSSRIKYHWIPGESSSPTGYNEHGLKTSCTTIKPSLLVCN